MAWRDCRNVALFLLGLSCTLPQPARAEEEPKKFEWKLLPITPSPFPAIEEDNCGDETNWTASILHSLLKRACQVPMGNTGANSGGNFVIRSPCEDQGLVKYRQQIYCWTVEGPPAAAADYIAGLASVEAEPLPCLLGGHTVLLVRQRVACVQTPRNLMRAIAANPRGSVPFGPPPRSQDPRLATPAIPPPTQSTPPPSANRLRNDPPVIMTPSGPVRRPSPVPQARSGSTDRQDPPPDDGSPGPTFPPGEPDAQAAAPGGPIAGTIVRRGQPH